MRVIACVVLSVGCSRAPGPKLNDEVKVESTAAPGVRASTSTRVPNEVPNAAALPVCVLSDREWRHVTLWPSVAGLEAYRRPRAPSPQVLLRMRGERGAFHVAHGTKCDLLESSTLGARVRVLEGPAKGRTGWVRHEWHIGK